MKVSHTGVPFYRYHVAGQFSTILLYFLTLRTRCDEPLILQSQVALWPMNTPYQWTLFSHSACLCASASAPVPLRQCLCASASAPVPLRQCLCASASAPVPLRQCLCASASSVCLCVFNTPVSVWIFFKLSIYLLLWYDKTVPKTNVQRTNRFCQITEIILLDRLPKKSVVCLMVSHGLKVCSSSYN